MKRNKDWLDELGGMLREADTPPPAGGWERLERDLPAVPKGTWFIRHRLRVAAVAAAVLIGVMAGDAFRRARVVQEDDVRVVAAWAAADGMRPEPLLSARRTGGGWAALVEDRYRRELCARIAAAPVVRGVHKKEAAPMGHDRMDLTAAAPRPADSRPMAEASGNSADRPSEENRAAAGTDALPAAAGTGVSTRSSAKDARENGFVRTKPRGKVAFGVFVGGGAASSGRRGGGFDSFLSEAVIPGTGVHQLKYDYRNFSYDHKLPLSFGVTFGKEFPYGLSIESGVVYSLLRSEAVAHYGGRLQQRLHLIGIPLRVNWRMLDRSGFSLYIGAGVMAEKCVRADFGSERIAEKGLQGSVFGAAGIQYRLGGPAALYFEPGVSYYFTRTRLRTVRTDSPTSFSLQLGVRFSF